MADWTEALIADQAGRIALITGANSGIGLEAARMLATNGAHVVLACRSRPKAEAARKAILVKANATANDAAVAQRLWDVSVELTGVPFTALGPAG